jgi:hypothetical protein
MWKRLIWVLFMQWVAAGCILILQAESTQLKKKRQRFSAFGLLSLLKN